MTSHQTVAVDVPRPPAEDGRVERTATAGRTLGAGGSAGTNRAAKERLRRDRKRDANHHAALAKLPAIADEWAIPYWRLRFTLDGITRCQSASRGRTPLTLPTGPLLAKCTPRELATALGHGSDGAVHRWKRLGRIPYDAAERAAEALRYHPAELWGTQWHACTALITEGLAQ